MTREYTLRVAGVSHANDDGSSRQLIIGQTFRGMAVELRPEPQNRFDPDATAVWCSAGQLGYVPRSTRDFIGKRRLLDLRWNVKAITGGFGSRPTRGVLLRGIEA